MNIPFTQLQIGKRVEEKPESKEDKIDKLTKQIHVGRQFDKKIADSSNLLIFIYNSNFDVYQRGQIANYVITKFCAPTARGATNKDLRKRLMGWRYAYALWQNHYFSFNAYLEDHFWKDQYQYWRKRRDLVEFFNTRPLPYFDMTWDVTWESEDVSIQWALFLQETNSMPVREPEHPTKPVSGEKEEIQPVPQA